MNDQEVIVFDNLRQRTAVVGQYSEVSAVSRLFVSSNDHGVLHEIKDHNELGALASQAGKKVRELLATIDE